MTPVISTPLVGLAIALSAFTSASSLATDASTVSAAAETGVSILADDIATAVVRRLESPRGRVVRVDDDDAVVVDIPRLPPMTELTWLVHDGDIRDPETFELLGTIDKPCGTLIVNSSDGTWSRAVARPAEGCSAPTPGLSVRGSATVVTAVVRGGRSTPAVRGLLDVLVAILPERLRRSGVVEPVDPVRSSGSEATIQIDVAEANQRVHVLVEVVAVRPRPLRDIAYFDRPLTAAMLWRERLAAPTPIAAVATLDVNGRVLAMTHATSHELPPWLLVLTERELLTVRQGPSGELTAESLVDLSTLPVAEIITRRSAGSLVSIDRRTCFATTALASGWCLDGETLRPIDGYPVRYQDRLMLSHFIPGTDILDGSLRREDGVSVVEVGPFLAARESRSGVLRVLRPNGQLEPIGHLAASPPPNSLASGDAWAERALDRRAQSLPVVDGPDGIALVAGEVVERTFAVAGTIVALDDLDLDRDGIDELVVATIGDGRQTRLTVLRP